MLTPPLSPGFPAIHTNGLTDMGSNRQIIRDLAQRVREIAESDEMHERRAMFRAHNSARKTRPPVLCRVGLSFLERFWEARGERVVASDSVEAQIEKFLRGKLMKIEIGDDEVVDPALPVNAVFGGISDFTELWGVPTRPILVERDGVERGAFRFNPPIKEERDLDKLSTPSWEIDEDATQAKVAKAMDLLDGILDVKLDLVHGYLMGAGLAFHACFLRGLDQLMMDMAERPAWTHRLMAFLRDALLGYIERVEREGMLSLTAVTPLSQQCLACDDLPQPGFEGEHVRLMDLWGSGDSQEFTMVSPDMMDEFLLSYQRPIQELFGLNSYGCCESFHNKWHLLKRIPRLRRLAVSRWTSLEEAIENMGPGYVYNWRVNSTNVLLRPNEAEMRREVEEGLRIAGDCPIEVVLQDIETVPGGLTQLRGWVRIAKDATERSG